jgi:hypothetical protein
VASTITQYSNLINVNYPVPGEDNDSQGFRSNFANIQSALSRAEKEITDIQVNAVNLNETNDFGNNVIKRASLQNSSQVVANIGNVNLFVNVDYSLGSYQTFNVDSGTHTFTITNWPESGQCGAIRLEITPNSPEDVSINFGGNVTILSKTPVPITYNQQSAIIWELWSPDNGTTIYAHELGLPNTTVTGTSIVAYDNVKIGDNKYTVRSDTSATVVTTGNFIQEVGLVPHITTATIVEYGCSNDVSSSTTTTGFTVDNIGDIKPGAIFWFNSVPETFTVESVSGNQITTQVFDRASLSSDPAGTSIRFVSTRYIQPTVIHTTTVNPGSAGGDKYDLKGHVFMNDDKLWLAHKDYQSGTNQWIKVPLLNPSTNGNVFESVNTFQQVTIFQQSIQLPRYTTIELATAPADVGTFAFDTTTERLVYYASGAWSSASKLPTYTSSQLATLPTSDGDVALDTTIKRPMYYADGVWSSMSKLPTYTSSQLAALPASNGDIALNTTLGLPVFYYNGAWVQFNV